MEDKEYLFYEDFKARKSFFVVMSALFYIGTLFGVIALIVPEEFTTHNLNVGERIFFTAFCLAFATFLNVFLRKAKRFKYYLAITDKEVMFFANNKLHKYNINDLNEYEFIREKYRISQFRLSFVDDKKIFIATKKPRDLKNILDQFIKDSIATEDR